MIALIDGDMVIYAAAHANQLSIDLNDGLGDEPIVDEKEAVHTALRMVEEWKTKAGCARAIVCLSSVDSDSFRHRLWPDYKAGRTGKPLAYAAVRAALELEYEVYQEPGLEADDLMGIAGTSERAQTVIVSRDKDMLTVPATVFNPSTDKKPRTIRLSLADQMWMRQTMIGDAVDNYPGIPRVGEVKAQEILLSPHRLTKTTARGKVKWLKGNSCTLWESMVDYAAKGGVDEEHLITMAQVSRILRSGDYDKETRTVRLWRPGGQHEELKL